MWPKRSSGNYNKNANVADGQNAKDEPISLWEFVKDSGKDFWNKNHQRDLSTKCKNLGPSKRSPDTAKPGFGFYMSLDSRKPSQTDDKTGRKTERKFGNILSSLLPSVNVKIGYEDLKNVPLDNKSEHSKSSEISSKYSSDPSSLNSKSSKASNEKWFVLEHKNHQTDLRKHALAASELENEKSTPLEHEAPMKNHVFQCSQKQKFYLVNKTKFKHRGNLEAASDGSNKNVERFTQTFSKPIQTHIYSDVELGLGPSSEDISTCSGGDVHSSYTTFKSHNRDQDEWSDCDDEYPSSNNKLKCTYDNMNKKSGLDNLLGCLNGNNSAISLDRKQENRNLYQNEHMRRARGTPNHKFSSSHILRGGMTDNSHSSRENYSTDDEIINHSSSSTSADCSNTRQFNVEAGENNVVETSQSNCSSYKANCSNELLFEYLTMDNVNHLRQGNSVSPNVHNSYDYRTRDTVKYDGQSSSSCCEMEIQWLQRQARCQNMESRKHKKLENLPLFCHSSEIVHPRAQNVRNKNKRNVFLKDKFIPGPLNKPRKSEDKKSEKADFVLGIAGLGCCMPKQKKLNKQTKQKYHDKKITSNNANGRFAKSSFEKNKQHKKLHISRQRQATCKFLCGIKVNCPLKCTKELGHTKTHHHKTIDKFRTQSENLEPMTMVGAEQRAKNLDFVGADFVNQDIQQTGVEAEEMETIKGAESKVKGAVKIIPPSQANIPGKESEEVRQGQWRNEIAPAELDDESRQDWTGLDRTGVDQTRMDRAEPMDYESRLDQTSLIEDDSHNTEDTMIADMYFTVTRQLCLQWDNGECTENVGFGDPKKGYVVTLDNGSQSDTEKQLYSYDMESNAVVFSEVQHWNGNVVTEINPSGNKGDIGKVNFSLQKQHKSIIDNNNNNTYEDVFFTNPTISSKNEDNYKKDKIHNDIEKYNTYEMDTDQLQYKNRIPFFSYLSNNESNSMRFEGAESKEIDLLDSDLNETDEIKVLLKLLCAVQDEIRATKIKLRKLRYLKCLPLFCDVLTGLYLKERVLKYQLQRLQCENKSKDIIQGHCFKTIVQCQPSQSAKDVGMTKCCNFFVKRMPHSPLVYDGKPVVNKSVCSDNPTKITLSSKCFEESDEQGSKEDIEFSNTDINRSENSCEIKKDNSFNNTKASLKRRGNLKRKTFKCIAYDGSKLDGIGNSDSGASLVSNHVHWSDIVEYHILPCEEYASECELFSCHRLSSLNENQDALSVWYLWYLLRDSLNGLLGFGPNDYYFK